MLELKNVTIKRGDLCVADKINTRFQPGKIYGILGPNGAGKTSLISAIFGELKFDGEILFDKNKLNFKNHFAWKKNTAYMPQDSFINASLTGLEVVLLGMLDKLSLYVEDDQLQKAVDIMQNLGILHLAKRDIMSLSGGQRQMVMFASVLIKTPKILLLDEPVSALDMHHQCVLLDYAKAYTKKQSITTVTILHDLSLAAQFCDEILFLHDCKIKAKGEPKNVITKDIISELYKVNADIFYDAVGLPVIAVKSAIK